MILAIDTSCDDSAVAILDDAGQVRADVVLTQHEAHRPYGGVVPEISSRQHLARIAAATCQAFETSGLHPRDIKAVAATFAPGLIGSLLVGVQFAKGFAQARSLPFIGVHHIEGHLMAGAGNTEFPQAPFIALIVSGGHSALYACEANFQFITLGETRDDAAGEAFDKVGRLLGLSYPAGRVIDELAQLGDEKRFIFPIALKNSTTLDYSFSGLKTAARLKIEELRREQGEIKEQALWDFCAGFRYAVVHTLLAKVKLACQRRDAKHLVLGGGVVANSLLREKALELGKEIGVSVHIPPKNHCVDNAVMIARAARQRLDAGFKSELSLGVFASRPIDCEKNI